MSGGRRGPGLAMALVVVFAATMTAGPLAGTGGEDQFPRGLLKAANDPGCTIETRPVSFGEYDVTDTRDVEARGEVIYTCGSNNNPIRDIRIEISRGLSGSFNRAMLSLGDRLSYNLYLETTHRTVWGDGSSGTGYYFDRNPLNRRSISVNVYGLIPQGQDVRGGIYVDALVVKILF